MLSIRMAALTAAVLAATGAAAPLRADQLTDMQAQGQLTCGVTDILDPFSFPDPANGSRVIGYDVDVCAAVAKRLGLAIGYRRLPLAARIPELLAGNVDLLAAGLGYSPQRAEQIAFSHRYHVSQHMLLARKDAGFADSAAGMERRIGFIKGSSAQGVLARLFLRATLVEAVDDPAGYQALLSGELDAFSASEILLTRFANRSDAGGALVLLEPPLAEEPWAIGLRRNEPALLQAVNAAMDDMEASGDAQRIWDVWLGAGSNLRMRRGFRISPTAQ